MDGNYLWMFILIGNAVALFGLNAMFSGGTSAMSGGGEWRGTYRTSPTAGTNVREPVKKVHDDAVAREAYRQGLNQ